MDKVQLYDDERLDVPDALALQELVYEYTERVLSSLVGISDGALYVDVPVGAEDDVIKTTLVDGKNHISLKFTGGKSAFYQAYTKTGTATRLGRVITLDTDISGQASEFLVAVQSLMDAADDNKPSFYIWGHRTYMGSPEEDRRFWDSDQGAEVMLSVSPRSLEIVDTFIASATNPGAGEDKENWFIIGYVSTKDYIGAQPTAYLLSAYDPIPAIDELTVGLHHTGDEATLIGGLPTAESPLPASGFIVNSTQSGLIGLLSNVRTQLQNLIDSGKDATWLDSVDASVPTGLKQIIERIGAATTSCAEIQADLTTKLGIIATLEARIAVMETQQIAASAYFRYDSAQNAYVFVAGHGVESVSTVVGVAGKYVVELKTGIKAKAVIATPVGDDIGDQKSPCLWISNIQWDDPDEYDSFNKFTVNSIKYEPAGGELFVQYRNVDAFVIVTGFVDNTTAVDDAL